MDSLLEKIISEINSKSNDYQGKLRTYLELLKGKSEQVVDLGKVKIEIKKIQYEINQLHKELGKYVSKKYIDEDIFDFTYDEKYLEYLEQLKKVNLYLDSLKKAIK